jgi:putative nucleotidyltransferase-like protein
VTRKIEAWLARLSDPAGLNPNWLPQAFAIEEMAQLNDLLDEAGRHNIRPVLVRNLGLVVRSAPDTLIAGAPAAIESATSALLAHANELRLLDVARAVVLADVAHDLLNLAARAGLPVALAKGADFAEAAYGGLHNRTFTDIDLLVRPDAEAAVGDILAGLGFMSQEPPLKHASRTERKWTKPHPHAGTILVEVHTDMVHTPELRRHMSLTYDAYADPAKGGVTPAARLIMAALHGATSHLFARLQYVVDGLMIARLGVDAEELAERAKLSGARLPLATNLRLAAEIYGCPHSRELFDTLQPVPWSRVERRIMTAAMVISSKGPQRWRLLPRRYLYRGLLQLADERV